MFSDHDHLIDREAQEADAADFLFLVDNPDVRLIPNFEDRAERAAEDMEDAAMECELRRLTGVRGSERMFV